MVRKISSAIVSVAILTAGFMAFGKLNYLESSLWVFKLTPGQRSERRADRTIGEDQSGERTTGWIRGRNNTVEKESGRGRGRDNLSERSADRESSRNNTLERGAGRGRIRDNTVETITGRRRGRAAGSESIITENRNNEYETIVPEEIVPVPSEEKTRGRGGRVRAFLPGEKKMNLKNVLLYLAVFASFTVITIYTDQLFRFLSRHGKEKRQC